MTDIQTTIGYRFRDTSLLKNAFTHASAGEGLRKMKNNERLEFLGDRVLNLCAADHLMELFPDASEGDMSAWLAVLIDYKSCAKVAKAIGLDKEIIVGRGRPVLTDAMLGDLCEAVLGAIYRDGGMDPAREFFLRFWEGEFANLTTEPQNPKNRLQEMVQTKRKAALPVYKTIKHEGKHHCPVITVELTVQGYDPVQATAGSRKEAEVLAAREMIARIKGVDNV